VTGPSGDELPEFDLYRALEVDPEASVETIEAAFRSLVRRYHPDVTPNRKEALKRTKELNVARDWLTDPALRAEYDEVRAAQRGASRPSHMAPASPPPEPSHPVDTSRILASGERKRGYLRYAVAGILALALVVLPRILDRPEGPPSPSIAAAAAIPSEATPRPTVDPRPTTAAVTPRPLPTPTNATPTEEPTPSPELTGSATLTLSGAYSERITIDPVSCVLGHDLGSSRTYVTSATVRSSTRSREDWVIDLVQSGSFQLLSLSFDSVAGYFGWMGSPDPGVITNVRPDSVKIDIGMTDLDGRHLSLRGRIQCAAGEP
jgi:hypothetical protein